ncbi:MAG: 23S rRNA (pseudouridine(1915)-N(3))-methyltransferase RlmH [Deltaproteobacteria bacterium]|nr:23S rRNA (pseudouridine(1915)-N(3))-methyltransferase RlmH [Deltaproteobacteria bacterium]
MIKIKCMVVDKTRSPFLKDGESFYLERLEAQAIERRLEQSDFRVALDRTGEAYTSEGLASWLNRMAVHEPGWATFIIGSPLGLSKDLIGSAKKVLSLSKLTLTHEMSRLLLLEQLYRAMTILKGEKYHK